MLAEEDSKVLKEKSGSKKASLAPKITRFVVPIVLLLFMLYYIEVLKCCLEISMIINISHFRAQIRDNEEQREKAAKSQAAAKEKEVITHLDTPLEENLNRVDLGSETATNLDDAIAVLRYVHLHIIKLLK